MTAVSYLAVSLDGLGAHPAAWRQTPGGVPALFDPERIISEVVLAETGLLDLVTLDDRLPVTPEAGRLHGCLDAAVVLSGAARLTGHIGLFPTIAAAGEPDLLAARTITLDRLAGGRGGWRPRVLLSDAEQRETSVDPTRFAQATEDRFAHLTEFTAAVAELWEAWAPADVEPVRRDSVWLTTDAYPRVPRLESGPPLVAALSHYSLPHRFAARFADVVFVTPQSAAQALAIRAELRELTAAWKRPAGTPVVLADLDVVLADTESAARSRRAALDECVPQSSDAALFTGTPAGLAELLEEWSRDGGVDGFRLRPAVLAIDLPEIVSGLVPILQQRGLVKTAFGDPLRERIRRATTTRPAAQSSPVDRSAS